LKTTKPDAENAAKLLIDCMVRIGFLVDDALIARLVIEKWHGPTPGVDVYLRPLP
jgi:Holliday junction resolvase RusA-like endonuclease